MKYQLIIILSIAVLSSFSPLQAGGGIKSMLDDYASSSGSRIALQAAVEQGAADPADLDELYQAEETLAYRIEQLLRQESDVAAEVYRYLVQNKSRTELPLFKRFFESCGQEKGLRIYELALERASEARTEDFTSTVEYIAAAKGASLYSSADFMSGMTFIRGGEKLSVSGISGSFYHTSVNGIEGYIHESQLASGNEIIDYSGDIRASDIQPNLGAFTKIDKQKPTYYFTVRENEYSGGGSKKLKTASGTVIATVCGKFYSALCMEGSGTLNDGRCVNWDDNYCFKLLPGGCKGITASGNWVVSFHTLAVNRKEMPYGGVYYIPKTRGLKLPNGETHDGYWFAHDTGSAFTSSHNRIDMYSDKKSWVSWMESNLAGSLSPLEAYRVDNSTKDKVYAKYKQLLGQ
ncbi:MAG: 3D domain-containing protein [Candidatus Wallbacteria bacterium]|nr:3D domain-containing protein [Candidatus Wallbacteria bacterium]